MSSFVWTDDFLTGLEQVDAEHRGLFELLDRFEEHMVEDSVTEGELVEIAVELTEYAQRHFRDEEYLMREAGIDQRHVDEHHRVHVGFLHDVERMFREVPSDAVAAVRQTHDFLTHWLAYHILGMDQAMARQIRAVVQGASPTDAYDAEQHREQGATEPLLVALNGLFQQVSERNRELAELNRTLEQKVAERTEELAELNRHLERLSFTDALTGLPNRRHAMQELRSVWDLSIDTGAPLTCVMIDADHFKEVNDTYGHDKGDRVLEAIATTLVEGFRTDDLVCRLGGDEFFVICPDTDLAGGMVIAERVRDRISQLRVPTGGEPWVGSVSMGVAVRDDGMDGTGSLVKRADEAVYAAKDAGKNCVRSVQPQT